MGRARFGSHTNLAYHTPSTSRPQRARLSPAHTCHPCGAPVHVVESVCESMYEYVYESVYVYEYEYESV